MIYLFNNVYLVPDKTTPVRPGDDYGFISSRLTDSAFRADNFYGRVYDVQHNDPLFSATSYDELISTTFGGAEDKLFTMMCAPRANRLIIICDEDAMLRIAIRTFKTMLPNATPNSGVNVLKYVYLPYFFLHDSGLFQFLGPKEFQAIYTNLISKEDQVRKLWVRTQVWPATARQRDTMQRTAGVELQTATYLSNHSWSHAADYKAKVVTFAKKSLVQMLAGDLRQKLLDGFVDIAKLVPEFDPLADNVLEQVAAHPVYRFLTDPQFTASNWRYIFDTYDVAALYDVFVAYAPLRAFNMNDFSLLAKENALTFEDVMARELTSRAGRGLLGTDINYKDAVNVYLLDLAFDLYHTQPATLKQYSLERLY